MFPQRNIDLLIVTKDEKRAIKLAAKIESEVFLTYCVDNILQWYGEQNHLPDIELDGDVVEKILISRKGSIEKTKIKIDTLFAIKCLIPELAAPRDIFHPDIQNNFAGMVFTPLPRLNHDNTRVNLYRYTTDIEHYNFKNFLNYLFMCIEYRLKCDYSTGDRSLIDLQNRGLGHVTKENPGMLKNCEIFIRKAYGIRVMGLHVINAPNFLNSIINIVKSSFTTKLSSRIHVHSDYEDLYKFIDKDILPIEYGGSERPATELVDEWKKEFAKPSIREYLKNQETLRSDESKRVTTLNVDLLGISKTFKNLEFD